MLTLFCLSKLNKNCNTLLFAFIYELKSRNGLHDKPQFYFTVFSFQSSKHILKELNCIQVINFHSNLILVRFESRFDFLTHLHHVLTWHNFNFHTSSKANDAFLFAAALFRRGKQEEGRTEIKLQLKMSSTNGYGTPYSSSNTGSYSAI